VINLTAGKGQFTHCLILDWKKALLLFITSRQALGSRPVFHPIGKMKDSKFLALKWYPRREDT
jgi:hypothetical protein